MIPRRQKIILSKNRTYNGGTCLITTGLFLLVLVYGGITVHILNRGEISRSNGFNRSELFPHGKEGNLETHPRLQHHDLSSLFLEGLPPLRTDTKNVPPLRNDTKNVLLVGSDEADMELDPKEFDPNTTAEQNSQLLKDKIYQAEMKYLRGRMPID